ncbi:copper chaperone CopZ [Halobacillus naozhouensis]|uniref:Copper chaperone CopZ n=1 Tax=Halobacillus naozhouensis TaxID=554880 RepID=A0ABY8IUR5_9BACI|nr:copper chaperone CopZ [Halobacillus naozhouensis]WFT73009.1 copper chaperone CopZ [Halobacillus naozhouensis]
MQTKTIHVEGMTCGHCEKAVKGALQELNGVDRVEVNLETGKVTITYEGEISESEMNEAIEEQGYDVVS